MKKNNDNFPDRKHYQQKAVFQQFLFIHITIFILFVMTAVTFPLRLPRLAFAICG